MNGGNVDLPPVWMAGFAALGGLIAWFQPIGFPYASIAGASFVAIGLAILFGAAAQLLYNRTTVMPGQEASRLVTTGFFRLSRNPIYVADVVVLIGLYLYWHALLALPLVVAFIWIIRARFILPEESRLRQKFGPDFNLYKNRTRRWI